MTFDEKERGWGPRGEELGVGGVGENPGARLRVDCGRLVEPGIHC